MSNAWNVNTFSWDNKKAWARANIKKNGCTKFKFTELSAAGGLLPFHFANGWGGWTGNNMIPFEFIRGSLGIVVMDFPGEKAIKRMIELPGAHTGQDVSWQS